MIYPPSFFSPLRALSISKIFISLKTAYLTMVGKFFKFMMYRLLANAFASQKILPRHFYHFPSKTFLQVLIISLEADGNYSLTTRQHLFHQQKEGEGYGAVLGNSLSIMFLPDFCRIVINRSIVEQ